MNNRPPRVAAIHDLSGFGRCSLGVILPVLSAMGVQAVAVPTAVLSSHTGGFGEVVLRDLSDYTVPALNHYKRLGIEFECIYSGYLSSDEQIGHCIDFFDAYPKALKVVDPVMGDHGKPYRSFSNEMCSMITGLAAHADVITPNLTEAYIMLGENYDPSPLTVHKARSMLARLAEKGPQNVIITGVTLATGQYANIGYDRARAAFWKTQGEYIPAAYPGTGDMFAAVLTGSLLTGHSLPMAMDRATKYVELTIKTTFGYSTDPKEGVMLERTLGWLTQQQVAGGYEPL